MPDLFTLPELAAYMQVPSVNEDTGNLLLELATGLIEDVYGAALPDPAPSRLKRIALEVVKRAYLNPNGYTSETLGEYSYNRGSRNGRELDQAGIYLTDAERSAVASAGGRSTVRTAQLVQPFYADTSDGFLDTWT